jgi:hypothetical protein
MDAKVTTVVEFKVEVTLTEGEVRALDAIAGYGADAFLKVFHKHLGSAYIRPFDNDFKELCEKIKTLRPAIKAIRDAREKLGLPKPKGYGG